MLLVSYLFFQGLWLSALAAAPYQLGKLIVFFFLVLLLASVGSRLGYCHIAGSIISSRSRSAAAILARASVFLFARLAAFAIK